MSGRLSMWVCAVLCAAICGLVSAGVTSADTLPDGRFYEQVTPEEKYGSDVYQPIVTSTNHDALEVSQAVAARSTIETEFTFQAAADGSGIAYVAGPTVEGNENEGQYGGNEYLARREPDGDWSQQVLSPENAPSAVFQAFSANLGTAFLDSTEPLSPLAPGFGESPGVGSVGNYDVLYSMGTAGKEFTPLVPTKPPFRAMGFFGTAGPHQTQLTTGFNSHRIGNAYLALEGASADDSHRLFAANDALTEASEGRPGAEGGAGAEFESEDNLYESTGGRLRLVNVLPDGTTHANATFGGVEVLGHPSEKRPILSRAISADGSRIFWTDLTSGHIYMREDGMRTVEVSPAGTYQTATSDGSTVFYTNGDLYAYEVSNGHATDLTPGVTVEQVVGSSENGEYIYYLTDGKKLALWHAGVSTAVTSAPIRIENNRSSHEPILAEVTPDGRSIVFMMEEEKEYPETHLNDVWRVNVYDAVAKTLYCASCTSGGTLGFLQMTNAENVYQPRWISKDGTRVFFVSWEGLVPQDTNEIQDVYEWERPGAGGCTESTGCVYLLSGGTSTAFSGFLDASESGNDVFIVTRSNLVGSDEDGLFDVYDVRVGQSKVATPACTGTGCQGLPSAPPIFATPSSVTFEGVGNFAAPVKETKAKSKPKPKKKPKRKKKKSKAKKSAHKANGRKRSSSKGGRS